MKNTDDKNKNQGGSMDQRMTRTVKAELYITLPATAGEIKHRDAVNMGPGLQELQVNDIHGQTITRVICSAWEYNQAARMIACYNAEPVITLPDKF
jgi:hypothetical protein